ncbi:MAG: YbhB/YbcL family Raf kinase inhibitor-like protein [Actinomycetota bacterium]
MEFRSVGYKGPCPPNGVHHYVFTLYALTSPLPLPEGASSGEVRSMLNDALATATLVGTYSR